MDKIDITKKISSFVVGMGTGKIVTAVIGANVPTDSIIEKITVYSAGVVIGMMAKDATKQYTDVKIDEAVAFVHQIQTKAKPA